MRQALAFLTPLGGGRVPTAGAVRWFPAVGALIGLGLGGLWWAAAQAWPGLVSAALVVAADLAVTGMLHFDGLVDSADGLLPHLSRERRLQVMASPEVGAFGVGAGGAVLLVRLAALASLTASPLLLASLWCLSRTAMGVALRSQPYARAEGGLASAFLGGGGGGTLALAGGVVGSLGLAVWWGLPAGPVAVACAAAAAAGVVWLARRRLGGFTGDVLGASAVLCETVGLVVAAARW